MRRAGPTRRRSPGDFGSFDSLLGQHDPHLFRRMVIIAVCLLAALVALAAVTPGGFGTGRRGGPAGRRGDPHPGLSPGHLSSRGLGCGAGAMCKTRGMNSVETRALTLCSLGGASTVTGSKHLLESGGTRILVDCGLFQGVKNLRELNWAPLAVDPQSIDAVIVTHAHLDHTGYLPRLVRDGFRGPIVSTKGTAAVAAIILRDSAYLQERDAAFLNKHKASSTTPPCRCTTATTPAAPSSCSDTHPFGREFTLQAGPVVTFRRAGHILGAATVDVSWQGRRIVFTGDLGRYDDRSCSTRNRCRRRTTW